MLKLKSGEGDRYGLRPKPYGIRPQWFLCLPHCPSSRLPPPPLLWLTMRLDFDLLNTKFWKCHSVQKLNNNVTLWFKKNLFFHTDKLGFPYIETEHRTKKTEFHWGCSLCFQKVVYVLKSRPSGLFGGTTWGASCPRSQEGIAFDPRRGQLSGPQTFLFTII